MNAAPACPRFLDPVVWDALLGVASAFARRGIRLFLFGSFASGEQRLGSDLDLGFRAERPIDDEVVDDLRDALDALPTIRRIDLVDFDRADPEFAAVALRSVIALD
jgi:predicted nucleotidyltransferase